MPSPGGATRRSKGANPPPVVLPQKFIIDQRLKEVEELKFRNSDFEAKITVLEKESAQLQEQKAAITKAIEELRMGLKFESTISSKVFFGQDAAKDSDDNVLLQIRMLEDELHRKKIQWSKLRHGNHGTTDDISESRLRKSKCAKVAVQLEEEFKEEQARMEAVLTRSNSASRDLAYLEQRQEEIMNRTEKRGEEQKEEQDELMEKLDSLRQKIDAWETRDKQEEIERAVMQSAGLGPDGEGSPLGSRAASPSGKVAETEEEELAKEKEAVVSEQFAAFQQAFRALMRETGESDIRKIVEIFMAREEDNYALYNYLQRVEHSIQAEEQKLAQITRDTQQYLAQAEGQVEQGSSAYKRQVRARDELVQGVKDSAKELKSLNRSQRRWHAAIEQFLCLLFGSHFDFQSQLLRQTSGVSELIIDLKNLLRTKTMFGTSASQSLPSLSTPAILISDNNALLGFAVIEQTVAEIMPAFIDAMASRELNETIRGAAMNKFGTLAPAVARRPTVLEGAAASKAGKAYDVVAPELADVNPDAETLAARHPVDADGHNLVATGGARKTVGPGGAVAGDAESQNQHPNNRVKKLRATSARRPSARFERIQSAHAVAGGPSSSIPFNSETMRAQLEEEMRTVLFPRGHHRGASKKGAHVNARVNSNSSSSSNPRDPATQ
eukprot:INCI17170.2.p1 GENE.INCI17170.2~~INCI17170.2.p1  ORF type:complete len:668 (+),score=159.90 INCI17170.2:176-2179(+)